MLTYSERKVGIRKLVACLKKLIFSSREDNEILSEEEKERQKFSYLLTKKENECFAEAEANRT